MKKNIVKESVEDLTDFIKEWIRTNVPENNNFHILCYSKNLVNSIYRELCTVYKKSHFNLLTSQTSKKKDVSFVENKHNIGTNFATGVDIKKENDALIVIYPCKYTEELVKGADGIFSDGLPSILQAVARLRKKGRILFTIPPVKYSIKDAPTLSFLKAIPVVDNIALKDEGEQFLKNEKSLLADIITEKKLRIKKEEQRYIKEVNEEVKKL
ncbi:MAG: hypothetical protein IPF52_18215 [Saprospiraceae bacterium]|nr:hypothetical protein [Saprospiraceae bacterium]